MDDARFVAEGTAPALAVVLELMHCARLKPPIEIDE